MVALPLLYTGFAVIVAALALVAVWSRRSLRVRAGAVALLGATLAIGYFAYTDLLSRPKPVLFELRQLGIDEADVLAAALRENEGIYLWLKLPGIAEPRYYVRPWNRDEAVELQDAMQEADRNRMTLRMRLPFEKSLDDRDSPMFYALPQPQLPNKPYPPPLNYRHESLAI